MTSSYPFNPKNQDLHQLSGNEQELLKLLNVPIPREEALRLQILRQTELLYSDQHDTDYDRFTSMVYRVFEVSYVFVHLIDLNEIYTKSFSGERNHIHDFKRDGCPCSYAILDESPQVTVITNLLDDERFLKNEVIHSEKYQFYASTPLIIEGMI